MTTIDSIPHGVGRKTTSRDAMTHRINYLQEEMEIVFMVVFTTEMLTKILALGFMLHKGSYMRNPWNFMDFFVVTSG